MDNSMGSMDFPARKARDFCMEKKEGREKFHWDEAEKKPEDEKPVVEKISLPRTIQIGRAHV